MVGKLNTARGIFFEDGCQAISLGLSTGADDLGLLSAVSRRLSAYLGVIMGTWPAFTASPKEPVG